MSSEAAVSTPKEGEPCCDTCAKRELKKLAVAFCGECDTKMCDKHEGFHADFPPSSGHKVMTIETYKEHEAKFIIRYCTTHPMYQIDAMCTKCEQPHCVACRSYADGTHCSKGGQHQCKTLQELMSEVRLSLKAGSGPLSKLQNDIDSLMIFADEHEAKQQKEVDVILESVKVTMQDQIQEITQKYVFLDAELRDMKDYHRARNQSYKSSLSALRNRLQSLIDGAQQIQISRQSVDGVIEGMKMSKMLEQERSTTIPPLWTDQLKLIALDKQRGKEMYVQRTPDLVSLLEKQINGIQESVKQTCCRLTKEWLVAGRESGYDVWDRRLDPIKLVRSVAVAGWITGCAVWKDEIYVLHWQNPKREVLRHDKSSYLLGSWNVADDGTPANLAIIAEVVIIPCPTTGILVVYSFTGQELRKISLYQPHFVAPAYPNLVICVGLGGHLSSVNVSNGLIQWSNTVSNQAWPGHIQRSNTVSNQALPAVDNRARIWVAQKGTQDMNVLSPEGKPIATSKLPVEGQVSGMSIFEQELCVITDKGVSFFKIHF